MNVHAVSFSLIVLDASYLPLHEYSYTWLAEFSHITLWFDFVVLKQCRTWWQDHYVVVISATIIALVIASLASGGWFVWKRRRQSVTAYKPVDVIIPEQELQPL